jgi:hypothetical protein
MFKQVPKEVYEILSKHYRGEVRCFIDLTKPVRSKEASKKAANGEHKPNDRISHGIPGRKWNGKGFRDNVLALGRKFGNTRQAAAAGTLTERVQRAIDDLYHRNAFTQLRRSTITEKVRNNTSLSDAQIGPVISKMIAADWLRVVPVDAKSALDVRPEARPSM